MYKTDRQYQSDLCRFTTFFEKKTFHKDDGSIINKTMLFNSIYSLHRNSQDVPFDPAQDTMCQLLDNDAHPNIRTRDREYVNFNEKEALKLAAEKVIGGKAIAFVRENLKEEKPTVMDVINIVKSAMLRTYFKHEDIDGEIESVLAAAVT